MPEPPSNSGSLRPSWMTKLFPLSLRQSPDTLWVQTDRMRSQQKWAFSREGESRNVDHLVNLQLCFPALHHNRLIHSLRYCCVMSIYCSSLASLVSKIQRCFNSSTWKKWLEIFLSNSLKCVKYRALLLLRHYFWLKRVELIFRCGTEIMYFNCILIRNRMMTWRTL